MSEEQRQIDDKIREIDRSIAQLQSQRQDLVRAMAALNAPHPEETKGTPEAVGPDVRVVEKAMNMLEWRAFRKKDGEWAFLRDMNGRLVEDLTGVADFVDELRKGRQVTVGKYRYSVSEDKFLNRFIA